MAGDINLARKAVETTVKAAGISITDEQRNEATQDLLPVAPDTLNAYIANITQYQQHKNGGLLNPNDIKKGATDAITTTGDFSAAGPFHQAGALFVKLYKSPKVAHTNTAAPAPPPVSAAPPAPAADQTTAPITIGANDGAHVVFKYKKIDGKGSVLAQAYDGTRLVTSSSAATNEYNNQTAIGSLQAELSTPQAQTDFAKRMMNTTLHTPDGRLDPNGQTSLQIFMDPDKALASMPAPQTGATTPKGGPKPEATIKAKPHAAKPSTSHGAAPATNHQEGWHETVNGSVNVNGEDFSYTSAPGPGHGTTFSGVGGENALVKRTRNNQAADRVTQDLNKAEYQWNEEHIMHPAKSATASSPQKEASRATAAPAQNQYSAYPPGYAMPVGLGYGRISGGYRPNHKSIPSPALEQAGGAPGGAPRPFNNGHGFHSASQGLHH